MKNVQIVLLIFIATAIAVLISFMQSLTTYETVASARNKSGRFIHLIANLNHTRPVEYDAVKNPNYLSFTATDTLGTSIQVIYRNAKPDNLETSERLVLKGTMKNNHFECKEILLKCPSKYKDNMQVAKKSLSPAGT